jgi:carboxynorspermidine decarboxylase
LVTKKGFDVAHFVELIKDFKKTFKGEVFIEPGSAIGWGTGFLKSTVLDLVEDGGIKTAILDISFSNHMPDCLEMPYKPVVRETSEDGIHHYRLGGCTCLAGDYIDGFQFDEALNIGDELIFEDMAHYTTVKTTTFNGINLPSIATLKEGGTFVLNKEFGYEEYKSRL